MTYVTLSSRLLTYLRVKNKNSLIKNSKYYIFTIGILLLLGISLLIRKNGLFKHNQITQLTHSWDTIIPNQQVPQGVPSLNAKSCGICHTKIFEEWKKSTHSLAWVDKQYQAELAKNKDLFVCKNCHLPVQNQQEKITTGLINGDYHNPLERDNPLFDESLQQEGITCIACHMNNNTIIGSHENIDAAHPVKMDKDYLSEKLCIACHDAHEQLSNELVCTFETGKEWREGPYPKEGKNCISCHMPLVERPSASGAKSRKGHRHFFPASGIPKNKSHQPEQLVSLTYDLILPDSLATNTQTLGVTITNKNAGHKVPTGDPERFILIQFDLLKDGQIIQSDTNRIGEKWQWWPTAKKLSDNNLAPKERRTFTQDYAINPSGNYTWKITVTKHRMTKEIHDYHQLPDDYPLFINLFEKEIEL